MFTLSREQLRYDLEIAYTDAKRNKSTKEYVINFDYNELDVLCDELYNHTYIQLPLTCFIINCPKPREIFAADFRDRIVQHLLYNYLYELFERTFIYDSYSCRIGKGTHFGIDRLEHHIKAESQNYSIETYCLKMDIKGYFIHINRQKLLDIVLSEINKYKWKYENILDFEFIAYLCREIILHDPTENCIKKFTKAQFRTLPKHKSLFYAEHGCGIPIGNLTSQLFSNIYLNVFDQYVKRVLKCKHYGRYVDDFFIISSNKHFLHIVIPKITMFLKETLYLDVQQGKTQIKNIKYGVEFLGAYIKTYRRYISNSTLRRMKQKINNNSYTNNIQKIDSIKSLLGILSHYKSHNIIIYLVNNYL